MDGGLSKWDISNGIILLLNTASHYSGVHPKNIPCKFICSTQFPRFCKVQGKKAQPGEMCFWFFHISIGQGVI